MLNLILFAKKPKSIPKSVFYTGIASQTVKVPTYPYLTINPTSGITASTGAATSVNDVLTVSTGTFSNGSNFALTVVGGTTISSGAAFNSSSTGATSFSDFTNNGTWNHSSAGTLGISGNFDNSGSSFTTGSGLYTFSGAAKAISGTSATTITNASISGSYTNSNSGGLTVGALTVPVAGSLTLNNNIAINTSFAQNGSLFTNASQVTGAGTFTLAHAATAFLYTGNAGGISTSGATGQLVRTGTRTYNTNRNFN